MLIERKRLRNRESLHHGITRAIGKAPLFVREVAVYPVGIGKALSINLDYSGTASVQDGSKPFDAFRLLAANDKESEKLVDHVVGRDQWFIILGNKRFSRIVVGVRCDT
jgi:hypothetical protein